MIKLESDIEMTGEHPHPQILTTRIRANLFVNGKYQRRDRDYPAKQAFRSAPKDRFGRTKQE